MMKSTRTKTIRNYLHASELNSTQREGIRTKTAELSLNNELNAHQLKECIGFGTEP